MRTMIRLHVLGDGPPEPNDFADALRAIADDIALGGWAGDTIVDGWTGRTDVDLGLPIITGVDRARATRFVTWSLTWDKETP